MSLKIILCLAAITAASTLIVPAFAQQGGRVFELRTYTCNEGKLPDLLARFRNHTVQIFEKHGMTSVGYWVPQDAGSQDTLIYILAHPSREAAKKNWAA